MIGGLPGVIAGGASSNAVSVALSSRTVPRSNDAFGGLAGGIVPTRAGQLFFSNTPNWTSGGPAAGEWVASGASATVGDGYEIMATTISGAPAGTPLSASFGVWHRIDQQINLHLATPGSFTASIRPFGGGTVLATATITVT